MNMRGFSLVEIMVGLAMLGGLSLGAMKISENQRAVFQYHQSRASELELYNQIRYMLQDKNACTFTLQNLDISAPTTVNNILNDAGNVFTGSGVANVEERHIQIEPFGVRPSGSLSADFKRSVILTVNIRRLKGIISTFSKDIYLTVLTSPSNIIQECLSEADSALDIGKKEMCDAVGGVYLEGPPQLCDLNCPVVVPDHTIMDGNLSALSTGCLDSLKDNYFNNRYGIRIDDYGAGADGIADVLTGNLQVDGTVTAQKDIVANTNLCVGGNCHNFMPTACTPGQVIVGIDNSGNLQCVSPGICGPLQYFRGINASGAAICEDYLDRNECPAGEFVERVNPDGTFTCSQALDPPRDKVCPTGQYIAGIDNSGDPVCRVDLNNANFSCPVGQFAYSLSMGTYLCRPPTIDRHVFSTGCGADQVMQGISSTGSPICVPQPCIVSTWSPETSTECDGVGFTQTSNCGTTQAATGTATGGSCGGTATSDCDISNIEWTHNSPSPPFNNQQCFGGGMSLSIGASITLTSMECQTPSTVRTMDNDGSVDLTCVDAGDGTTYLQYDNQYCPCSGGP